MDSCEKIFQALKTQACGAERVDFGALTKEDLEALYAISKSQDMAHIVAAELHKQGALGQDEIGVAFKKQKMLAIFRYEQIQYEFDSVCKTLELQKIRHLPLKGSVLRQYYPEPWMRTSADIDILIPIEEYEKAQNVLIEELEYTGGEQHEHDISMYAPNGVHLELHFGTIEEYCAVDAKGILDDIWQYAYVDGEFKYRYCLPDEWFYFYHVAHMAKHFEYGGCGLRFFLDMWILTNRVEFDAQARRELLERGGLLQFAKQAEELAGIWFGDGVHTDLTIRMQYHVLNNGVYGTQQSNIAWKQITQGGKNERAKNMIFLPYEQMVRKYPSLQKHKILLPFCHIRRWCSALFHGRTKSSIDSLKLNAEVANSKTEPVRDMLKELELIH